MKTTKYLILAIVAGMLMWLMFGLVDAAYADESAPTDTASVSVTEAPEVSSEPSAIPPGEAPETDAATPETTEPGGPETPAEPDAVVAEPAPSGPTGATPPPVPGGTPPTTPLPPAPGEEEPDCKQDPEACDYVQFRAVDVWNCQAKPVTVTTQLQKRVYDPETETWGEWMDDGEPYTDLGYPGVCPPKPPLKFTKNSHKGPQECGDDSVRVVTVRTVQNWIWRPGVVIDSDFSTIGKWEPTKPVRYTTWKNLPVEVVPCPEVKPQEPTSAKNGTPSVRLSAHSTAPANTAVLPETGGPLLLLIPVGLLLAAVGAWLMRRKGRSS